MAHLSGLFIAWFYVKRSKTLACALRSGGEAAKLTKSSRRRLAYWRGWRGRDGRSKEGPAAAGPGAGAGAGAAAKESWACWRGREGRTKEGPAGGAAGGGATGRKRGSAEGPADGAEEPPAASFSATTAELPGLMITISLAQSMKHCRETKNTYAASFLFFTTRKQRTSSAFQASSGLMKKAMASSLSWPYFRRQALPLRSMP